MHLLQQRIRLQLFFLSKRQTQWRNCAVSWLSFNILVDWLLRIAQVVDNIFIAENKISQ